MTDETGEKSAMRKMGKSIASCMNRRVTFEVPKPRTLGYLGIPAILARSASFRWPSSLFRSLPAPTRMIAHRSHVPFFILARCPRSLLHSV